MATAIRNNVSRNEMPPVSDVSPPENPAPITRQGDEVVSPMSALLGVLNTGFTRANTRATFKVKDNKGELKDFSARIKAPPPIGGDSEQVATLAMASGATVGYPQTDIDGVEVKGNTGYEGVKAGEAIRSLFSAHKASQTVAV